MAPMKQVAPSASTGGGNNTMPKKRRVTARHSDTCSEKCLKLILLSTIFGIMLIAYLTWIMSAELFSGKPSETATCTMKSAGKRRSMFDPNWVFFNDFGPSEADLQDDVVQETRRRMLHDGVFVTAVGSCNKHSMNQSFWEVVHKAQVDVMAQEEEAAAADTQVTQRPEGDGGMIWLGDVVYADTNYLPGVWTRSSDDTMALKYHELKTNPYYSKFVRRSKHVLGVWDDHDMGCNDGGKNCPTNTYVKQVFLDFLDVKEDDKERRLERDGVYSFTKLPFSNKEGKKKKKHEESEKQSTNTPSPPADIYESAVCTILLDARSGREDIRDDRTGSMLSEQQWSWLEDILRTQVSDYQQQEGGSGPTSAQTSSGPPRRWSQKKKKKKKCMLTVIGSGVQVLADEKSVEQWAHFQGERSRLFALLGATRVERAIFVSGDVHLAELQKASANPALMWKDLSKAQLLKKKNDESAVAAAASASSTPIAADDDTSRSNFLIERERRAPKVHQFLQFLSDLSNRKNRTWTGDLANSLANANTPAVCVDGSAESMTGGYPIIDITASGFTHSISELVPDRVFDTLMPNSARRLFRALGRNFVTISLHPGGFDDLTVEGKRASGATSPDNFGILQVVFYDVLSKKPLRVFRQPLSELMYDYTLHKEAATTTTTATPTNPTIEEDDAMPIYKVDQDPWSPTFGQCALKQQKERSLSSSSNVEVEGIQKVVEDKPLVLFQDSADYPSAKPVLTDLRDHLVPMLKLHHLLYVILFSAMIGGLLSVVLFILFIWYGVLPRMFTRSQ